MNSRQIVRKLRPIDDTFFRKLIEEKSVCQEVLRVILEDELVVEEVTAQASLTNLLGRSVVLDALCVLHDGTRCNVEVQKDDRIAHHKRVRYNAAIVTTNCTDVGTDFSEVPNVIVVYITVTDIFGAGLSRYHARTTIVETGKYVEDGFLCVYANTSAEDGTEVSELMKCFMKEQVMNEKFPELSARVGYFKNEAKGVNEMCDIVEEYARELSEERVEEERRRTEEEVARSLFLEGAVFDMVKRVIPGISEERLQELRAEVIGH